MSPPSPFQDLIARVRSGDEAAAAELVRQYEPEVRRLIRVTLSDPRLRRLVDSTDICQSVLAAFFVRVAAGQYDLAEPVDLIRLLARMAQNRLLDYARKPAVRRTRNGDSDLLNGVVAADETPSDIVSHQELMSEVRRRLTAEEAHLAAQRAEGKRWDEIGSGVGLSPEAARKRLERALDRVCRELGIDRVSDE